MTRSNFGTPAGWAVRKVAFLAVAGLIVAGSSACGSDPADDPAAQAAARDATYCATYGGFDARDRLLLVDPELASTTGTTDPLLAQVTGTSPDAAEARRFLADSHQPKDAPDAIRPPVSLLHQVITDGDVDRSRSPEVAEAVDEINQWLQTNCPATPTTR